MMKLPGLEKLRQKKSKHAAFLKESNELVNYWLTHASIEIVPTVINRMHDLSEYELNGQYVYITFLPKGKYENVVKAAQKLMEYGAIPVAHIGARHLRDFKHLKNYVTALKKTGVKHVLLLGGDREQPVGEYDSSLALLQTGLFDNGSFRSVGFGAHPDGHPVVDHQTLYEAIQEKIEWAKNQPTYAYFVTQFVLESCSLLNWYKQISNLEGMLDIYVGLPGLTETKKLFKFVVMSGIGWARIIGMVVRHPIQWSRFLTVYTPTNTIEILAHYALSQDNNHIKGMHFYTFGGFKATAQWLKKQRKYIANTTTQPSIRRKIMTSQNPKHYTLATDAHYNLNQTTERTVPVNLRQSGNADINMLISTRVRKSPFWHKSVEAGCNTVTVYNNMYHPRCYTPEEEGGLMKEYEALTQDVTLWNVAVERQICIKGPDALEFTNRVVTRDLKRMCPVNQGRYVILCDENGGIINDPVLLRIDEDEFWLSVSDSDVLFWCKALNYNWKYDVEIKEIDVAPVQIQGPKSQKLMRKLFTEKIDELKYYKLWQTQIDGMGVVISRTGFSGEVGYEVYLRNATYDADRLWETLLEAGEEFNIKVIAPGHIRRIEAGIQSYRQDMDIETNPFEVRLGWQVELDRKPDDYVGKEALARISEQGVKRTQVGLLIDTESPITWYNADFWLVYNQNHDKQIGYITSAFYSPKMGQNIALAMVPIEYSVEGTKLICEIPGQHGGLGSEANVCPVPFFDPEKKVPLGQQASSGS
jgi:aminomethyltransferase